MSFRRIPKEIDPRRPPKRRAQTEGDEDRPAARSYGQYLEMTPAEIAELERASGEVAREGASPAGSQGPDPETLAAKQKVAAQEEFEEMTDEVSREEGGDS